MLRRGRIALRIGGWAAAGLASGLAAATVLPVFGGWRAHSVLSGSMTPAIRRGDLVMLRPIAPLQARLGDIVSFPDPSRHGERVMHRVVSVSAGRGVAHFVTRGDANHTVERWDVRLDGRIGKVVFVIPKAGYLAVVLATPVACVLLLVLPALGFGALELVSLWRRPPVSPAARRVPRRTARSPARSRP
jgi:signal peptidase I